MMWMACEELGLFSKLGLDRARFRKFITKVESGYNENPYHARW